MKVGAQVSMTRYMLFFSIISIIVPTRNRVEDLRHCLAGGVAQSFTDHV